MTLDRFRTKFAELSIWWYAFGYFALYIPYSALTKALSDGLLPGQRASVSGFLLLPLLGIGSMIANWIALSILGWWRFAGRRRLLWGSIPWPGAWTAVAGFCTALIIPTTSLAYTFTGVSILFIMLLMRGGVLVVAPLVDFASGRQVHWYSWTALLLALVALWVGFAGRGYAITAVALANAAVYVTAYFFRLRAMSRLTKSDDLPNRMRYFVEEQMVAPPVNVLLLALFAFFGTGAAALQTRGGFSTFLDHAPLVVAATFLAGFISQVTGICGTLTLMDRRENTFCVPVNRASSVLSGIAASFLLWWLTGARAPVFTEYAGAALLVVAMLVLSVGPRWNGMALKARLPRTVVISVGSVAAVAAAVAAYALGWNPDYAMRRTPLAHLPSAAARPAAEVRVLLTSDFGHQRSLQRSRVVSRMRALETLTPFDLVLVGGDNVDGCGPDPALPGAGACSFEPDGNTVSAAFTPPADEAFERLHDGPFASIVPSTPPPAVFVALGNHDVAATGRCAAAGIQGDPLARLRACLEVAHRTPTWQMPGRHYAVDAGPVRFIVIDGNLLNGDYGGFDFADEEAFVRKAAEPCLERLCFIVSHYPPATGGIERRRQPQSFLDRVARLERAAGGRARGWLAGHHHDLQHLRAPSGLDTFIFGNSSAARGVRYELTTPESAEQLFFSTAWGFAVLEAAGGRWWMRIEDVQGRGLHCCAAVDDGRCEPELCGPVHREPMPGARVGAVVIP